MMALVTGKQIDLNGSSAVCQTTRGVTAQRGLLGDRGLPLMLGLGLIRRQLLITTSRVYGSKGSLMIGE